MPLGLVSRRFRVLFRAHGRSTRPFGFARIASLPALALPGLALVVGICAWVESAVGIMLILGFQTRLALIVGGLMMTLLTFGTMQIENFQNAWLQLTYALVFFVVLVCRSWNLISLDAMMKRR